MGPSFAPLLGALPVGQALGLSPYTTAEEPAGWGESAASGSPRTAVGQASGLSPNTTFRLPPGPAPGGHWLKQNPAPGPHLSSG